MSVTGLWESAARRLFGASASMGLGDKTLVLNTPRADLTDMGDPDDSFRGQTTTAELTPTSRDAAPTSRLGYRVLPLPEELQVAHSDYKWGLTPITLVHLPTAGSHIR